MQKPNQLPFSWEENQRPNASSFLQEDDDEETQEMTEVLASAKEISMETLTSGPGGPFMLKGKEKIAPNVFCLCVKTYL